MEHCVMGLLIHDFKMPLHLELLWLSEGSVLDRELYRIEFRVMWLLIPASDTCFWSADQIKAMDKLFILCDAA